MIGLQRISATSIIIAVLVTTFTPAFAEVTSFELDKTFYSKGDAILFSGTVDDESNGLVTIVIRDSNNEFVLLTQAFIQPDNTFERDLVTNERFEDNGIHNATAFVIDLAKGKTVSFDFSQDGTLPTSPITPIQTEPTTKINPIIEENNSISKTNSEPNKNKQSMIADFVDPTKDPQHYLDRYYNEPAYKEWFDKNYPGLTIEEAVGLEPSKSMIADFVDPTKDPQHYLDRYYNEPAYKEWFDKNYPGLTIEEAVGLSSDSIAKTLEKNLENVITKDVIPDAEAIPPVDNTANNSMENNEMALLGLTLGGLTILFGAVYGIKRKVDTNSKNISHNRESIRRKIFGAILNNNPDDVIKNRLAHGEITVSEYNNIKKTLRRE